MLVPRLAAIATAHAGLRLVSRRDIILIAVQFVLIAMTGTTVAGTNGTWINATSGGLWSDTANWSGGTIAKGIDGIADFSTLDITGDNTVHLDSARTIGQLLFADTNPTNNWILDNGGNASNTLTFGVSSQNPQITVNNQMATLNLGIIGTNVVTSGSGTLVLGGTTDNTGLGLTVTAGTTVLGKASSSTGVHAIGGGGLTVNGGIAQLGGSGGDQIYDSANVTVESGAFDTNGLTEQFNSLSLAGTGISGTGALVNSAPGGSVIFLFGTTTLTGDATIGVTQSSGSLTLATSSISGGFGITKVGPGTLNLIDNSASTFTGATNVNDGTLLLNGGIVAVSNTLNIGDGIGVSGSAVVVATSGTRQFPFGVNVAIRSDGVLNDQDSNEHINALTMTGGIVTGTGVLIFGPVVTTQSSPMTAAISVASIYLNVPNQRFTIAQGTTASGIDLDISSQLLDNMAGPSDVIKAGAGTMRLAGNNMFTGGVTLNAGTLVIGNNNALGAGTLTAGGGALAAGNNGPYIVSNAVSLSNTLSVSGSGSFTSTGPISGSGGLTKTGSGALTLSGVESFSGPINITGGTLVMNTSLSSDVTNSATFLYNSGAFGGRLTNLGTVMLNADFTASNGLENDGTAYVATGVNVMLNGAGLLNTGSLSMTGGTLTLSSSGTNVNSGSVALASVARLNLSGATLTNSGMLILTGGLVNGAGGTLVNAVGGTISGTGTINCAFNNSHGLLEVGSGAMNITQSFNNSGVIQLTDFNSTLTGGAITSSGTINGFGSISNSVVNATNGTVEALGGILNLNGVVQNQAGALLTASSGNKLLITQGLGTNAGILNLAGGTFDNNGFALNNTGQISGWGIFRTGGTGLDNNGSITFSGGVTTVNGPLTNEGGRTITVAQNSAIFTGLVKNNMNATFNTVNATATFAGGFTNNGNSNFAKAGGGVVEIDSAPTLNNGSTLSVTSGTLRFNVVSGTPTIGTGVRATVSSGATLELAGSVSALASGANRVNITNNSTAPGILISGTHQQVGGVDGSGTMQVNAGSDLTANHIIQSVLAISGTSKNPGLVTIDASDASGDPLGQPSGLGLSGSSTLNIPFEAGGISSTNLGGTTGAGGLSLGISEVSNPSAVPEPSNLLLLAIGGLALGGAVVRRRRK